MTPHHYLQAHSLYLQRSQQCLFSNLSLQVSAGELLIIEGANGCGKSTLLRLLAGFITPTSGEIHWNHTPLAACRSAYLGNMHYIGHQNGHKSRLTVTENLRLLQQLSSARVAAPDLATLLNHLHLQSHADTLVHQLSAGQQRRVALARLFLANKPLWLLDEPLTALDTTMQAYFIHSLETHLQQGGLAIISTHQPLHLSHAATRTLRLSS